MKQNNFFIMLLVAGFTSIMTAQVPSYVPTDGLVGYWPFNGNANDVSTNANNGTNNGATLTTDRFGNTNSAYSFNGLSSYIQISDNTTLDLTNDFSISSWFNANSFTGPVKMILSKHRNSNDNGGGYVCGIWNPYQFVNFQASPLFTTQTYPVGNSGIVLLNNWYNLTITYQKSSGTFKYYLNGLIIDSKILTFNILNTTQELLIGAERLSTGTSVGYVFSGKIDDIGIWNRALTTDEISNLYNANICYENITVTDTLVINLGTLSYNPVTYNNSITIYPNPAKDRITIDCGTLSAVTGYQIKISNLLGQEVFSTTLNQQQYSIPLNSWTGKGIYLVTVYDANRNLLTTRKIDLQ